MLTEKFCGRPLQLKKKTVKAIKPETITPHWRKPCSDIMHEFTGFTTEPIKERDCRCGKKGGG